MTEREIFLAVLELSDDGARSAYLDQTCRGDAALRAEVEALLESHATASDFLETPALASIESDEWLCRTLLTSQLTPAELYGSAASPYGNANQDWLLRFLSASERPDSLGRIGNYEVVEILGRGGFGIVLRAFDESLHRLVALKVLSPELAASEPARQRFLREARSAARVRHENVVRIYGVEESPLPTLVMELVPGETLQQRLDRTGPLDVIETVRIGQQIAAGLAAAHREGLIHRDIKPANILIEPGPHDWVKLTDFGVARAADDASISQTGIVSGTPMYMAPEQADGDPIDHRSDLFSLGSVLYTMCCGCPPFRAANALVVMRRVVEANPRPIPELRPDVPAWLCGIVSVLHAKDPAARFASAQEVADVLSHCLTELRRDGNVHSVSLPSTISERAQRGNGLPQPSTRPPHRTARRMLTAGGLLLTLAVAVFGATEATHLTNVSRTVVRLFSPEGTLVVDVNDPGITVAIAGEDIAITGAGIRELRLKPGQYQVQARKDGKLVRQEWVNVMKDGRRVLRISREPPSAVGTPDADEWHVAIARLPATEQVRAVAERLKRLNPEFDGQLTPSIQNGVVTGLELETAAVSSIAPVCALTGLKTLICTGQNGAGRLTDLSPLKSLKLEHFDCTGNPVNDLSVLARMPLKRLVCRVTQVHDLSPLKGLDLTELECGVSRVTDLAPLRGMQLTKLVIDHSYVVDLTPLRGMPLTVLHCGGAAGIRDLSPLAGMPLRYLHCGGTGVTDLSPLRAMPLQEINCPPEAQRDGAILRSITSLQVINYQPADQFWQSLDQTVTPDTGS